MSEFFRLDGRVALVTGGGRAIGAGVVRRLAAAGAKVAIFDAEAEPAGALAAELGGIAIVGDVRSERDVVAAIDRVEAELGPLAILVNNAGVTGRADVSWSLTVEEFREVFEVNVVGPFLFCKAAAPRMLAHGYGRILNVASIAGKEGNPTLVPYSASKAAVIAMTKAIAKELAGKANVTVNAIAPAVIRTPMVDALPQSTVDYMVSRIPMGRTGAIDEVAALIHYLVSAEASFCTGAMLRRQRRPGDVLTGARRMASESRRRPGPMTMRYWLELPNGGRQLIDPDEFDLDEVAGRAEKLGGRLVAERAVPIRAAATPQSAAAARPFEPPVSALGPLFRGRLARIYSCRVDFDVDMNTRSTTRVLGGYYRRKRLIRVYTHDQKLGRRPLEELFDTFLHEVAHHLEYTEPDSYPGQGVRASARSDAQPPVLANPGRPEGALDRAAPARRRRRFGRGRRPGDRRRGRPRLSATEDAGAGRRRWVGPAKRVVKLAIAALVLAAVGRHCWTTWNQWHAQGRTIRVDPGAFGLSMGLYLLGLSCFGLFYGRVMQASPTPIGRYVALAGLPHQPPGEIRAGQGVRGRGASRAVGPLRREAGDGRAGGAL